MPRVVLDGWAWMDRPDNQHSMDWLRQNLVITPTAVADFTDEEPRPIRMYEERDGLVGVPREFFWKNASLTYECDDRMSDGRPIKVTSTVKPGPGFEEQALATEVFLKHMKEKGRGGVLQAGPAWGKTAWALHLASVLGVTTLVVVNREFLLNQWKKRIEKFLPDAKIGIVQQDECNFEGKDIVLGMVHSLSQRTYAPELYAYFGLVIFDECHRVPAQTWSQVPPRFPARYRIGLSATPRRKDGADPVIWWHIGDVVYRGAPVTVPAKVRRVYTKWVLPPKLQEKKLKMPIVLKLMVKNDGRNQQILSRLLLALKSENQRKVMVLSDRLEHLNDLAELVQHELPDITIDRYVGGRGEKALTQAETARLVLATYQMAQEALDIPALDTVFLVTPRGDVEQSVGRVQRICLADPEKCAHYCPWRAGKCEKKPDPIVVDFVDDDAECQRRYNGRIRFYAKNGMLVE